MADWKDVATAALEMAKHWEERAKEWEKAANEARLELDACERALAVAQEELEALRFQFSRNTDGSQAW